MLFEHTSFVHTRPNCAPPKPFNESKKLRRVLHLSYKCGGRGQALSVDNVTKYLYIQLSASYGDLEKFAHGHVHKSNFVGGNDGALKPIELECVSSELENEIGPRYYCYFPYNQSDNKRNHVSFSFEVLKRLSLHYFSFLTVFHSIKR